MKLEVGFVTDTGKLRGENEDSLWTQLIYLNDLTPLGLFIVCDGMGGHMGGRYASYWAVEAIKSEFGNLFSSTDPRSTVILSPEDFKAIRQGKYKPPPPMITDLVKITESAIQKANKVVFDYASHKPVTASHAGTTMTMMAVRGDNAVFANIGDSRSYRLRDHDLKQITKDHSLVAMLVEEGQIQPDEVFTHPNRNVIYRYLGQKDQLQPDIFHLQLQPGDRVLLCSDGLWEMVRSKQEMVEIIEGASDSQAACQALLDAANEAGGDDNISVVLVKVS
jgi:serine/threonine protein phosphatase PrpC